MADEHNDKLDTAMARSRQRIATAVVVGAIVGLVALAAMVVIAAAGTEDPQEVADATEKMFTMVVPMLATWVGTVIAYYFSGENFERASRSVNKLVGTVLDEKLKKISVEETMIPRARMKVIQLPAQGDGSSVNLQKDLIDAFVAPVTRMPVLRSDGVVLYIIHQSEVFGFVTRRVIATPNTQVGTLTLKDFLDVPEHKQKVESTKAFVSAQDTLADAKRKMEAVPGCQDVFVTENGDPQRPVEGWLTNIEIQKRAKA